MVLDFAKEAIEHATKKKICFKCKNPIEDKAVCAAYIVHVCEDGDEYECWNCWKSKEQEAYEKEKYAREILERILAEIIWRER